MRIEKETVVESATYEMFDKKNDRNYIVYEVVEEFRYYEAPRIKVNIYQTEKSGKQPATIFVPETVLAKKDKSLSKLMSGQVDFSMDIANDVSELTLVYGNTESFQVPPEFFRHNIKIILPKDMALFEIEQRCYSPLVRDGCHDDPDDHDEWVMVKDDSVNEESRISNYSWHLIAPSNIDKIIPKGRIPDENEKREWREYDIEKVTELIGNIDRKSTRLNSSH